MAIVVFTLIGTIPDRKLRMSVNDKIIKMAFRMMCRPLSAVVTFYNTYYRRRNMGFCVTNHTSPMDVAILGADCTFLLVVFRKNPAKINEQKQNQNQNHFARIVWGQNLAFTQSYSCASVCV